MNPKDFADVAIAAGDLIHRTVLEQNLKASIRDLEPECGSCFWWMTRECPIEEKVKPSMNHCACSKFREKDWVTALRQERQKELDQLTNSPMKGESK